MIRPAALPVRVLAAAFAVFALAGCVKKQPTEVSPTYTPEGTFSAKARLIVYPDLPSVMFIVSDRPPIGVGPEDVVTGTTEIQKGAPGTLRTMLFDGTQASAFELLRREANGGYLGINDFLIPPARKWIDGAREVYVAEDDKPGGYTPFTYMMRGLIGGAITADSPLTNAAIIGSPTIAPITYTGLQAPSDSLFTISWLAVPGAAGYWIQVYQFLEARRDDQIISGVPAPAYVEKERDYFLGYLPSSITSYKLGSNPDSLDLFTRRTMLRGQIYLVRIAAVDAAGDMIAYTYGDFGVIPSEEGPEYTLFPLGAKAISVLSGSQRAAARPVTAQPIEGVDLWMGDLPIVRAP